MRTDLAFERNFIDKQYTVRGKSAVASGFYKTTELTTYQWCQVFDGKNYRHQLINEENLRRGKEAGN